MDSGARRLAYSLPLLAAISLFGATLGYDLTFDDKAHIAAPGVAETRSWSEVWSRPTLFYRPVVTGTFWIENRLGTPIWLRHAVNVALHGAVTVLVVRLALGIGLGAGIAGLAGLLFAVHPVHVEAVAGIVGRADLLAALWLLVALGRHDRVASAGIRPQHLAGAALLAFLAASTKESAWGLPAFALALDLIRRSSPLRVWPLHAAYALGIGAHLVIRHRVLGSWLTSPRGEIPAVDNPLVSLTGWDRLIGGLQMCGLNLAHLAFPVTLAPDYSGFQIVVARGFQDPRVWGGSVLVLGCLIAVVWGLARNEPGRRALALGGSWLGISAFMVMNLVYTIETILADRLLYWPSIAWVLLLGGGASLALSASPSREVANRSRRAVLLVALGVSLAGAYAVRALRYLPAWQNNATLFRAAVTAAPNVPRAWYNLGFELHQAGDLEGAIAAYRRAQALSPEGQEPWAHEAAALMQLGRWQEARRPLAEALRLDPADPIALVNSGIYWLHEDSLGLAIRRFEAAVRADSTHFEAWYNLGLAREEAGRDPEAELAYRRCLRLNPEDAQTWERLAKLIRRQGREPEGPAGVTTTP